MHDDDIWDENTNASDYSKQSDKHLSFKLIASFRVRWTFVTQLFNRILIFSRKLSVQAKMMIVDIFVDVAVLFVYSPFHLKLLLMHWNERSDWKSSSSKTTAHFRWSKCSAKRSKERRRMQLPLRQWNKHPKQWKQSKKICMSQNAPDIARKFTNFFHYFQEYWSNPGHNGRCGRTIASVQRNVRFDFISDRWW